MIRLRCGNKLALIIGFTWKSVNLGLKRWPFNVLNSLKPRLSQHNIPIRTYLSHASLAINSASVLHHLRKEAFHSRDRWNVYTIGDLEKSISESNCTKSFEIFKSFLLPPPCLARHTNDSYYKGKQPEERLKDPHPVIFHQELFIPFTKNPIDNTIRVLEKLGNLLALDLTSENANKLLFVLMYYREAIVQKGHCDDIVRGDYFVKLLSALTIVKDWALIKQICESYLIENEFYEYQGSLLDYFLDGRDMNANHNVKRLPTGNVIDDNGSVPMKSNEDDPVEGGVTLQQLPSVIIKNNFIFEKFDCRYNKWLAWDQTLPNAIIAYAALKEHTRVQINFKAWINSNAKASDRQVYSNHPKLYDKYINSFINPNDYETSFTLLYEISAYCKPNDKILATLLIFAKINRLRGHERDVSQLIKEYEVGYTPRFQALLAVAYISFDQPRPAMEILESLMSNSKVDVDDEGLDALSYIYTTLMEYYSRSNKKDSGYVNPTFEKLALELFDRIKKNPRIPKNIYMYAILLKIHARNQSTTKFSNTYKEMRAAGIKPNQVVFNVVLRSFFARGRNGWMEEAEKFYWDMVIGEDLFPNLKIFSSFLVGYSNEGFFRLEPTNAYLVHRIVEEYEFFLLKNDVIGYNVIIHHFARLKRMERAMEYFNLMVNRDNLVPDISTFNILLFGYLKTRAMASAKTILAYLNFSSDLNEERVETAIESQAPDQYTFGALMIRKIHSKNRKGALQLFNSMSKKYGLTPSKEIYQILMNMYVRCFDANSVIKLLKHRTENNIGMDLPTYHMLMKIFLRPDPAHIFKLFEQMIQEGLEPNSKIYNTVVKAYINVNTPNSTIQLGNMIRSVEEKFEDERSKSIIPVSEPLRRVIEDNSPIEQNGALTKNNSIHFPHTYIPSSMFDQLAYMWLRKGNVTVAIAIINEMFARKMIPWRRTLTRLLHTLLGLQFRNSVTPVLVSDILYIVKLMTKYHYFPSNRNRSKAMNCFIRNRNVDYLVELLVLTKRFHYRETTPYFQPYFESPTKMDIMNRVYRMVKYLEYVLFHKNDPRLQSPNYMDISANAIFTWETGNFSVLFVDFRGSAHRLKRRLRRKAALAERKLEEAKEDGEREEEENDKEEEDEKREPGNPFSQVKRSKVDQLQEAVLNRAPKPPYARYPSSGKTFSYSLHAEPPNIPPHYINNSDVSYDDLTSAHPIKQIARLWLLIARNPLIRYLVRPELTGYIIEKVGLYISGEEDAYGLVNVQELESHIWNVLMDNDAEVEMEYVEPSIISSFKREFHEDKNFIDELLILHGSKHTQWGLQQKLRTKIQRVSGKKKVPYIPPVNPPLHAPTIANFKSHIKVLAFCERWEEVVEVATNLLHAKSAGMVNSYTPTSQSRLDRSRLEGQIMGMVDELSEMFIFKELPLLADKVKDFWSEKLPDTPPIPPVPEPPLRSGQRPIRPRPGPRRKKWTIRRYVKRRYG